ncbi:MAG: acyl carrier protein [Planctomycetota bacterium]|nr:acyl carrier protein [Planctomycetota bacterium]MCX8039311.1 acyl carrier protein [Planctomycetota bacterium]MDW8372076.1 acyl carrier protein [Planctomycetota bacterium]
MMDVDRVRSEVLEILTHKLHKLPPLADGLANGFDYEGQRLVPDITDNHLDIAEVAMDLEDAFGINFEETLPGGPGMETIGQVIAFIIAKLGLSAPSGSGAAP